MPRSRLAIAKEKENEELVQKLNAMVEEMIKKHERMGKEKREEIVEKFENIKKRLPKEILSMPVKNVFHLFNDKDDKIEQKIGSNKQIVYSHASLSSSGLSLKLSKESKDDGYDTEETKSSRKDQLRLPVIPKTIKKPKQQKMPTTTIKRKPVMYGNQSARKDTVNGKVLLTKAQFKSEQKMDKNISRLPMQPNVSKKLENAPFKCVKSVKDYSKKKRAYSSPSIFRWAKSGERIYSITGTPIVPIIPSITTANINIPTKKGMVMLNPELADPAKVGQEIAEQIESSTINDIEKLQKLLDMIMKYAKKKKL